MNIARLYDYSIVLPFDEEYVKVGKGNKWNLVDADGNLISDTWFGKISRNTDGSIVTTTARNEEVKFVDVGSLKDFSGVSHIVPTFVANLVDSHSVERCDSGRYVAKALFYGMRVYITADGGIYDGDGNKLRILFNTVDTERLNTALVRLNKRLNYDYDSTFRDNTWSYSIQQKESIFSFYWVTSRYSVSCGYSTIYTSGNIEKWTDDFIVRVDECMPEQARKKLTELWGTPVYKENGEYSNWSWHFGKSDIDRIIDTLNSLE